MIPISIGLWVWIFCLFSFSVNISVLIYQSCLAWILGEPLLRGLTLFSLILLRLLVLFNNGWFALLKELSLFPILLLALLEFFIAPRAEPFFVWHLTKPQALIMRYFKITKFANNLFVFSFIAPADVAKLGELRTIVEWHRISNFCWGRWLFNGDLFTNLVWLQGIVFLEALDLNFAKWAQIVELGPAEDAVHAEGVDAIFWFGSFWYPLKADGATVQVVCFVILI